MKIQLGIKNSSPFDDSALNRIAHMGLINKEGDIEHNRVEALGQIMAGLFFDSLCDHYNEIHAVSGVYEDLNDYVANHDYRRLLLRYSLQYDMMRMSIPTAVWWLVGCQDVIKEFLINFMRALGVLVQALEKQSFEEQEKEVGTP